MKISLNWLKEYISVEQSPEKLAEILTDIGLEVEGISEVESVKGGLKGLLVGQVKKVTQHPNADRLQLTRVDVGHAEDLSIVCGAPNVAEGQKVLVALVGSKLYPDEKGFEIKKSKIRGEVSEGMLCAEDEIGLGSSHEGIMVLDPSAEVGMEAAAYFQVETDTVIEIGLTPNRVDAASHYGVARDLAAYFNQEEDCRAKLPDIKLPKLDSERHEIQVKIEDTEACPRYSSLSLTHVHVKDSPTWMQNRLRSIGLKPINNIVDISNYVLHELGQPLHAFDADRITDREVRVKTLPEGSSFITLDGETRKLSQEDLMICNTKEGMCIAGVFGGQESGVTASTNKVFLESAYFNPTRIRKTAKRHGLNTDASFRYERGADPEITVLALQRAAQLMIEYAGAKLASEIQDQYPQKLENFLIDFKYENCDRLLGEKVDRNRIKRIFTGLDIQILNEQKTGLRVSVPSYRVDVQREVDLIEEVLRMYGYNRIQLPEFIKSNLNVTPSPDAQAYTNLISDQLAAVGFSEIFNNSLSNPKYYQDNAPLVHMVNPLSSELEVLRASMLYGGLESLSFNLNRQKKNLKFFEFGTTYVKTESAYEETQRMALWITGDQTQETWRAASEESNFFDLKERVEACLHRLGISKYKLEPGTSAIFDQGMVIKRGKNELLELGRLSTSTCKAFDIKQKVYYAEFNWSLIMSLISTDPVKYKPVVKFPSVRRDLALLIDQEVQFDQIQRLAKDKLKQNLKGVNLFDVYEGKNLAEGKKSYAMSFTLQDPNKTLSDKQIDGMMERLVEGLKSEFGAELR